MDILSLELEVCKQIIKSILLYCLIIFLLKITKLTKKGIKNNKNTSMKKGIGFHYS